MERIHSRDMLQTSTPMARDTTSGGGFISRGIRRARSLVDRDSSCIDNGTINTCEKPAISSQSTLGALVGVGVGVAVVIVCVLVLLHMRRRKRDKLEATNDPHELSDYGLDLPSSTGGKGGKKGGNLQPPVQEHRLSAQQLMEAQNPFGMDAEIAETASIKGGHSAPPKYPEGAHAKEAAHAKA